MEYSGRIFKIDGRMYSWQLLFDGNGPICRRGQTFSFADKKSREKTVRVPRPAITKEERRALDTLFELFSLEGRSRKLIQDECLKKRWEEKAHAMIEKLARKDWEIYGKK